MALGSQSSDRRHPDQFRDQFFNFARNAVGDQCGADAFAGASEMLALFQLDERRQRLGTFGGGGEFAVQRDLGVIERDRQVEDRLVD